MLPARRICILIFSLIPVCYCSYGQSETSYNLRKLLTEKKLTVANRAISPETDTKKNAVILSEEEKEGLAWIDGVSFATGTIDIDLKGQDVYQHSFLGIAFHGTGDSTFDAIYFRPFQFRTIDPVRRTRGIQYISLPGHTWQQLREAHPGVYEKTVDPAPDPDDWFHARIVVKENEILVYVNDAVNPCLQVALLNKRKTGKIALYTADRSGGSFANLIIKND